MKTKLHVLAIAAALVSFGCGGDDGPEKGANESTNVGTGADAGSDAASNGETNDAAVADAGVDGGEVIDPPESPLCLGGTIDGADGCVESPVLELEIFLFSTTPNGQLYVSEWPAGSSADFPPDVKEPLNDYCFYEEGLQSVDAMGPCTDVGAVTVDTGQQSATAVLEEEICYVDTSIPTPFRTTGIDVSWDGGADAEAGMISGTAPGRPAIDVGFASNGNFRVIREEDDDYDGPMSFSVSRFDSGTGIVRSIECYTPGSETLVIAAEDVEEFGGFEGLLWNAEFQEVSFDTEVTPPVRLNIHHTRSGQFPE